VAKAKRAGSRHDPEQVRCVIYTRKSTEEGLEQEFNSLDAQREACSAYILSQRHEGWVELPALYDDGGFSGGNMDRPGLKQLLADVAAGKVDVIVLYKVDRLTRSLADFARIVEVLDGAGASFVSITQSFNTTTSMGRLTLNVLLSFAQFEREVTGERIRDKIAASKAKGMWMGGVVPLGYDVKERKLVINEAEAETVRMIFSRYVALGSTGSLVEELRLNAVVTKERHFRDGRSFGGIPFERGALAHLLKNRVYVGEVAHRDHVYLGEHQPIVDRELWERAQVLLSSNTRERRTSARATDPSLLTGLLYDGLGRPMTPTHATRGSRRYRYYVSRPAGPEDQHRLWRLPAPALEQLVLTKLSWFISGGEAIISRVCSASGETMELVRRRSLELAKQLSTASGSSLTELGVVAQLSDEQITIELAPEALLEMLLGADAQWLAVELRDASSLVFSSSVQLKRRGQELRLVFKPDDASAPAQVDQKLVELVVGSYRARERLIVEGESIPRAERPHLTRLARLSYLAPDIVQRIMDGRQPASLSARSLLRTRELPTSWNAQRVMLG
jgi:DNA invertase Pin-like site-specific DNA recombinase